MDEYKQNKMGRCSSINSVHEEHSLPQRNRNESFFGMKPRLGLANLNLDKEVTDEIWTEEQLNEVLEIEETPIEYQIEAPGLRNVINLVQDQVSTLAEGELADDIDGGQGCIFRLMCSHRELTKDHVLTKAYVKIFIIVTRNAVNKSV